MIVYSTGNRKSKLVVMLLFVVFLSVSIALPSSCATASEEETQSVVTLLTAACSDCHGSVEEAEGDASEFEGEFRLFDVGLNQQTDPDQQIEWLSKVVKELDTRSMPPVDGPALSEVDRTRLITALRQRLVASAEQSPFPRTPIRRMNRFQYNNAVVDLFELKPQVFTLPEKMMREHGRYFDPASGKMPDVVSVGSRPLGKSQMIEPRLAGVAAFPQDLRAEHGFDVQADHLSMSPLLVEAFLKLGSSITGSPDFRRKNVGVWDALFAEPKEADSESLRAEIPQRLSAFLRRAFRGRVDDETVERYSQFALARLNSGVSFATAMKQVAAAALASPRFLYLHNTPSSAKEPPGAQSHNLPLDDFQLASRLSFFLWGSLPDEELLAASESGTLSDTEILRDQVRRMLKDRRLKRFCDSFPGQWLQIDRIISSIPDRGKYPEFYYSKYRDSMHMMLEPLLVFETVLIEDRPITDLLDSDFSYRSANLEESYGPLATAGWEQRGRVGEVGALKFRRVPITDRRAGGVITTAAAMTMTSGDTRTKPITRGAWLASVILNDPPEPPPADVPPLPESGDAATETMTLREQLELHRQRADCRGCHETIDPLGFVFENFDAVGRWRDTYENGQAISAGGSWLGKYDFESVVELKDALLAEEERFCRGLASHLLSFAIARPTTAIDAPAIDAIVAQAKEEELRIQAIIEAVVLSRPFRMQPSVYVSP